MTVTRPLDLHITAYAERHMSLTADSLDRTGMHIEPDERTLIHTGASSRSRSAVALFATATRA